MRKAKCNKEVPCSACVRAGIRCDIVERARLPRGRSGRTKERNATLERRVSQLEALLQANPSLAACSDKEGDNAIKSVETTQRWPGGESPAGFVAQEFWAALAEEIAGIRETIEVSDDEDTMEMLPEPWTEPDYSGSVSRDILFPWCMRGDTSMPDYSKEPDLRFRDALLETYEARVDTIFKPLHWPTTRDNIRLKDGKIQSPLVSTSSGALEYAIYYLAVCSLHEHECLALFHDSKHNIIDQYRGMCETHISRARVLQTPDVPGLQAFVIYLQALRTCGDHALNWTLLAVAVRLATAIGLGGEDSKLDSLLRLESRRRLWFSICLMDTQATLDRGAAPLIHSRNLGVPPLNLNDSDIGSNISPVSPGSGLTDMSFCTMTFEAMVCFKKISALNEVAEDGWRRWGHKLELLNEFEERFTRNYLSIDHESVQPIGVLLKMSARSILANMRLLLRRTPYRQMHNIVPPWDDFDLMTSATEVVEQHMSLDNHKLALWAWKEWTPWYALAVTLAELCRNPLGRGSDRAYAVACDAFKKYSYPPTDPNQGLLWRPIAKLLRRVTELRGGPGSVLVAPSHALVPNACTDGSSSSQYLMWSPQDDTNNRPISLHQLINGSPKLAGLDSWVVDENLLESSSNDILQMGTYKDPDEVVKDLGESVSWLDWDLTFQNAVNLSRY
jgi:hypothetical protein